MDHLTRSYLDVRSRLVTLWHRARTADDGEGVISTAIAVLIMAFLGAAMWVAFNAMFQNASSTASSQMDIVGNN